MSATMLRLLFWSLVIRLAPHMRAAGLVAIMSVVAGGASRGAEQVKLAWDENTESGIAGYRVYYGVGPSAFPNTVDVGLSTTGTVKDLQPGTTYYFAVTAYNADGLESNLS